MKRCSACREMKQPESFGSNRSRKDGLNHACHACASACTKRRRATPRGNLANRWRCIMSRCYDQSSVAYSYYGGRGITTCESWRSCARFVDDIISIIGDPPAGMSLDRIDNNSGYRPDNVRWATPRQQLENRRPSRMQHNNKSGVIGVSKAPRDQWAANARRGHKRYYVGTFATVAEAAAALSAFTVGIQ